MPFKWNPFSSQMDYYTDDASSLSLVRTAGEIISGFKVLYLSDPLTCMLADNTNLTQATVLGIALNAGIVGSSITILSLGILNDPFFTFGLNVPIFLDTLGNITTVQPLAGNYLTQIGFGLGAGSVYIKINSPKLL